MIFLTSIIAVNLPLQDHIDKQDKMIKTTPRKEKNFLYVTNSNI